MDLLSKNLQYLPSSFSNRIVKSDPIGSLELSSNQKQTLKVDSIYFHSKQDPTKEAQRLVASLKQDGSERLYIFFGGGLGYAVLEALSTPKSFAIWMEAELGILKQALSTVDVSLYLANQRLKIIGPPFLEEELYTVFRGTSSMVTSFVPHRPSLSWKNKEYTELKAICDKFFHKKDVNIATLSRFEKVWTKNLLHNFANIQSMVPVSKLFGIAKDLPIVMCGAGPSLYNHLEELKKYREKFILIAVDTALHILTGSNIDPDLIYSVDPQPINSAYLQGYKGDGIIVFDPTSTYHTMQLNPKFKTGIFTSSPFPLMQLVLDCMEEPIGEVPFGGSVSISAVSLAELMGASYIYMVGQDLAFTHGLAHSKGAILEERLNFKETRYFRRELHNYRQLHALPQIKVESITGEQLITNEKLQIFRKWFEDRAMYKNWVNLSRYGGKIEGIVVKEFSECFDSVDSNPIQITKEKIQKLLTSPKEKYIDTTKFIEKIQKTTSEMKAFERLLKEGKEISLSIYNTLKREPNNTSKIHTMVLKMDSIDEQVSAKKGLNQIIAMGLQRVILTITEGYEANLTLEEKLNEKLAISKKSLLLYEGLYESSKSIRISLKKLLHRMEESNS